MGHFPALVNTGATANILLTIAVTWWLVPKFPQVYAPSLWIALVLCINLLPVAFLRLTLKPGEPYRTLGHMDFIKDQHRFSDWVYLAASANMAFWILVSWSVFSYRYRTTSLTIMLSIAFLVTFSPVLLRTIRNSRH